MDNIARNYIENLYKKIDIFAKEAEAIHKRICQEELENAVRDFAPRQAKIIKKVFAYSVLEFYSSYSPMFYERKGHFSLDGGSGGLYDALQINNNGLFGTVEYEPVAMLYNPGGVTGRNGYNKLFSTTFMGGFHGGASHGGKMLYRSPYNVYKYWGREASKSEPIDSIFARNIMASEQGEMTMVAEDCVKKRRDLKFRRLNNEISKLFSSIFG